MHLSKKKKEKDLTANFQNHFQYNTITNFESTEIAGENKNFENHNEPLYCRCQNISYGNMVECDNRSVISTLKFSVIFNGFILSVWN